MKGIKSLLLRLVYVVLFLLLLNYAADSLLVSKWLAKPVLTLESGRSTATWPLRMDPVLGWALAPPPEAAWAMSKEFEMIGSGVGARWLPAALDMGPPLKLLLLGDESTFGPGIPLANTYAGWIKRATERAMPERTVAVGNAAVPGYDALQMYLLFRKLLVLKPHLALFCFSGGQLLRAGDSEDLRRPYGLDRALRKELFYRPGLTQAIYLGLARITGGREVSGVEWEVSRGRVRDDSLEEFQEVIERIIGTAHDARITLMLTSLSLPESHRSVLERLCRREDVAYFDGDMALVSRLSELRGKEKDQERKIADQRTSKEAEKMRAEAGGNKAFAWWAKGYLRPAVEPVFTSRHFFDSRLLPSTLGHRILGTAAAEMINEQDLFSWRHRVLK